MSSYSGWGPNYYDFFAGNRSEDWRTNAPPQEQYNPNYPSYAGTSNFFSSSTQQQPAPTYRPTTTQSSSQRGKPKNRRIRPSKAQKAAALAQTLAEASKKQFHLVTVNPDPTGTTKLTPPAAKIAEPAPIPASKVAPRGINKAPKRGGGGGRGIQKMPNYNGLAQGNGWGFNNGYQRGGGGGGRPFNRGGRGGNRGGRFRGYSKPTNTKDDIPYEHLPEDAPSINLAVSAENIVAFHGFDSVFTTQHSFPVLIDNKIYTNCDHYYQIRKVIDLTGSSSERLNKSVRDENGKLISEVKQESEKEKKAWSAIAKEIIKASNIDKAKVEEWRNTKGLEAIQKALFAKASQSAHLREALKESGEKILVHAFPRDSIYGTGCGVPEIKKWLEGLNKAGVQTLRIPATFPLNESTVKNCPVFAQGRNILGVILMQIREKIRQNQINVVDMSKIYEALRVNSIAPVEPMDTSAATVGFSSDFGKVGTF